MKRKNHSAGGPFVPVDRDYRRVYFLLAVNRLVPPAVLLDLKTSVLPEYLSAAPAANWMMHEALYSYSADFPFRCWPKGLLAAAVNFTRRHHLTSHGFPPV
jgi:hypothetical protein